MKMKSAHIIGTISTDHQSRIRGLGRYAQALHATLPNTAHTLHAPTALHIHPFVNLIGEPYISADLLTQMHTIGVIHDVIPLKYPEFPWIGIKGKIWQSMNRMLLRRYLAFVTDSNASKADIMHLCEIDSARIHVIYPYSGIQDMSVPATKALLPPGIAPHTYIVYVGDVNWHKNIVVMAQAAIQANIQLVCVGGAFTQHTHNHPWSGALEQFCDLARRYPHLIRMTGFVDDRVLASLYTFALANILVSLDEGFGYAYIEAGHFGTPSILSDRPIFHEISGDSGALFVHHDNTEHIAHTIHMLQEDKALRISLGAQAQSQSRIYSKEHFARSWQHILDIYSYTP